jgi:hypothetical protein
VITTDDQRCVALGERLGDLVGQLATDSLRLGEKFCVPAGRRRGLWITDLGPRRVVIAGVERCDPRCAELCIETSIAGADGPISTPRLFAP